jgi:hypothetical protein
MNINIRSSGEVSSQHLYTPTYFKLLGVDASVTLTGSTETKVKPILMQLQDYLQYGHDSKMLSSADNKMEQVSVLLPSGTQRLSDQLKSTIPPLRYNIFEHVVQDLQLQLSFMIANGISVWSLHADDVYVVPVSIDEVRYLLLTDNVSDKGGSTAAFRDFVDEHVGASYQGTKLYAYCRRLRTLSSAEWV